jgi:hypothetical protein
MILSMITAPHIVRHWPNNLGRGAIAISAASDITSLCFAAPSETDGVVFYNVWVFYRRLRRELGLTGERTGRS